MEICDCHNDFFGELAPNNLQPYIDQCNSCGVKFLSGAFWTTKKRGDINEEIRLRLSKISNPKCFALHIEDLGFVDCENKLKKLIDLKPFSCSLTWNFDNQFAGGSYGENGLSKEGKNLIKILEKNNIIFDRAHLNKKSFFDGNIVSHKPPYISHSGFCFVCDDKRNLDDEQIDFVVKNDGFVGMFFYDKLSMKKNQNLRDFSVENVANNLVRFIDKFGCDNIGIGSDFFGIENPPKNLENYMHFSNLISQLKMLGMNQENVEKIYYKNFQHFLLKFGFSNML